MTWGEYIRRAKEKRERWTQTKLELIAYRSFPRWTETELAQAQKKRALIQIKFWTRADWLPKLGQVYNLEVWTNRPGPLKPAS